MRKTSLLLLTVLLSFSASYAQKMNWPLEFQLHAGLQTNSAPNLNTLLKENNLKAYPALGFAVGAQLGYNFKYFTLGTGINSASTYNAENWNTKGIYLFVSTNSIHNDKFIFSPLISFGGQFTKFDILKENLTGTFEDFLTSKSNKIALEHTADVLDIAFVLKKKKGNLCFPLFRIGYRFGLDNTDWKVIGATVSNLPQDKTGNFYAQVAFGIGRLKK